ncbi:efflux RND transporter periplasmic adaptor subunit [Paracoccus yeei]|uniref:Efflux RND transporter periplasmic adaptor subunit n=1 Tax=Paracoccus yeei TaxID=147645 RepID=A0A5P2QUE2_9RHOB|nr:efflux RND transporter periplasmic adaptor subunit [Paracoccus yeei]QEU09718.1 efflux RND transporter periplasmic adaptor subunit [Paracoccus yeei]
MRPRTILVLIALMLLLAGGWWFRGAQGETMQRPATAEVSRGDVTVTVLASGQIEASQLVSVGARASGRIETLPVTLGQEVREGDLIAQMDSLDQQNEVRQAEADLANIEAQIAAKTAGLTRARQVLERQKKLGTSNYSSRETVETATAEVDVAVAELEALEAQKARAEVSLSTAKISLERTRITAPTDGTVVAVVVEAGQTINSIQSAPTIVKLAKLDRMLVKAEISEADVVRVKPGQEVSFTILGEPDRAFQATLRGIEPAPSEIKTSDTISTDSAIYYNGLLEVENPGHVLRIGMTTQVTITLDRAQDVLRVPAAALQGQSVQVWNPATGTIETRRVEVGLNDKVWAEIRSGLSEGEQVVTGGVAIASSTGTGTGASGRSGGRRMGPPMGF